MGAYIYIDYGTGTQYYVGAMFRYANESGSHKTFVANAVVLRGIAPGTHSLTIIPYYVTQTDSNDYFSLTVMELPF
jgi:hypothetical protein